MELWGSAASRSWVTLPHVSASIRVEELGQECGRVIFVLSRTMRGRRTMCGGQDGSGYTSLAPLDVRDSNSYAV